MIIVGQVKPSLEELSLKHFGVKGMKWGVVRNFQRNRQLNKASRQRDRAANKEAQRQAIANRDAEIEAARQRFRSGKAQQELKDAKAQFKTDKMKLGSREARKKLNAVKLKNMTDAETANMVKSGAETTGALIGTIGAVTLRAVLASNSR